MIFKESSHLIFQKDINTLLKSSKVTYK